MKKQLLVIATLILASTSVFAAQHGGFVDPNAQNTTSQQGGFIGPAGNKTTVKQAKTFSDNTWVTLTGKIEQRVGGDHYLFRDSTDSVRVDIDDKRWAGQTVTPQDTVEIQGKVDKDWNDFEIDVKQIRKMK